MRLLNQVEQREVEIQRSVMRFYASFGCEVARFNEARRTRSTPGWPDLYIFCAAKRTTWMHECKAGRGVQSIAQSTMQGWAESCGLAYIIGGVQAAQDHLVNLGLIQP